MSKQGRIIALTTSKGGSGKTTLTCCLAAELLNRRHTVTLIDADPETNTQRWLAAGDRFQAATLIVDGSLGVTEAARLAAEHSTVFIDAAGATTSTTVAVLEAADIVLIPFQASSMDAVAAIKMAKLAADVSAARHRQLPIIAVFNRVSNTAITPHIRSELEKAGVKVAMTEIGNRTAFAVAALNGTAPCWMGTTAEKAAEEIEALVKELDLWRQK